MTALPPSPQHLPIDRFFAARLPLRLALWLALAIWFMGDWLAEPYQIGRGQDWAYFVHHTTVATKSWLEYGQVPMWNPWFCGGIPALANIQTDALSPDLVLTLPFDTPVAIALRLLLFIALGLEGVWRYARHHGAAGWGALLAAALFMFSGRFMMVFWDGHLPFMTFALAPWAFLGLEKAYERLRWAALAALALTWIFFNGGAVATPIIGLMLAFMVLRDTLARLIAPTPEAPRRSWYRPALALGVIALLTALLALPRLVPVFGTLIDYPRTWSEPEGLSLGHISGMLFLPPRTWFYFGAGTSYVGAAVGILAGLSLLLRERRLVMLAIAFVIAFDLAMGDKGPLHLWWLIHQLPVIENVRASFRFTFLLALFLAIGAGRSITWLEGRLAAADESSPGLLRWARGRPLAATLVAGGLAVLAVHHAPLAVRERLTEIPRLELGPEAPGPFHQALGTRWIAQVWPRANIGSIACFEEQFFPQSLALRGDLAAEEYLAEGDGTVVRAGWSPNEIALDVDSATGGVVVVNQNAAPGWSASGDGVGIVAHEGLLAARVPPGRQRVTFSYSEPGFIPYMIVSLATMAAIALWLLRRRREKVRA